MLKRIDEMPLTPINALILLSKFEIREPWLFECPSTRGVAIRALTLTARTARLRAGDGLRRCRENMSHDNYRGGLTMKASCFHYVCPLKTLPLKQLTEAVRIQPIGPLSM